MNPYDSTNASHKPVYLTQKNPDTVFIFKYSQFKDKRSHALDQKTNNPGLGQIKLLSEILPQRYKSTLDHFEKTFMEINLMNDKRDYITLTAEGCVFEEIEEEVKIFDIKTTDGLIVFKNSKEMFAAKIIYKLGIEWYLLCHKNAEGNIVTYNNTKQKNQYYGKDIKPNPKGTNFVQKHADKYDDDGDK